jgi:hypothetical protein
MALKDIMAISGQPGLFKFISQGRNGIIVESMIDGKRTHVSTSAKVSALSDIAIYTNDGEKPLREVMELIKNKENGEPTISHKVSNDELKTYFTQLLPDYDDQRVYVSDIKKVVTWYNLLQGIGMLDFSEEEKDKEVDAEIVEDNQASKHPEEKKKSQSKKVGAEDKQLAAKKKAIPKAKPVTAREPAAKKRIQQKKT